MSDKWIVTDNLYGDFTDSGRGEWDKREIARCDSYREAVEAIRQEESSKIGITPERKALKMVDCSGSPEWRNDMRRLDELAARKPTSATFKFEWFPRKRTWMHPRHYEIHAPVGKGRRWV